MKAINGYYHDHNLTQEDIQTGKHRDIVGGKWEEIGNLQFDFLVERGLQSHQNLLDVGCGALRGGIHFIRYLDPRNYFGVDLNTSLMEAGRYELEQYGLTNREPQLLVTDKFELGKFGVKFDYALAVSVFSHLPMNHIIRCLVELSKVLKPQGTFYATFFEAPDSAHIQEITHQPGGIITYFDSDPYHYSFKELNWMAESAGLEVELIHQWKHPRNQKMAGFRLV